MRPSNRVPEPIGGRRGVERIHVPWFWHLIPVGFVALWVGLAIQSLYTDDARFGWGMFKKHVDYRVTYAWLMADGAVVPYTPGSELRGPARRLDPRRPHWTTYSVGAVCAWVRGYARYMAEHPPRDEARTFRATLTYRINREGPIFKVMVEQARERES